MKRSLFLFLPFTCLSLAAQELPEPAHGLPQGLAPGEQELIRPYRDSRAGGTRGITTPPSTAPRTMAEWEEIQSLTISWTGYADILKQITRYAKEECEVIITCEDPAEVTDFLNSNSAGGPFADLDNITFLQQPFNSIWCRDYGAESMYFNEVDSLVLMDWIYNRPRAEDDALPEAIATLKGIEIFSASQAPYDVVHTGGNFMADGFGTAFSSELVLDENGPGGEFNQTARTRPQLEAVMEQWMGIAQGRYIIMPTLPYDGIHHIDMHMKLVDEERLLVGEFPVGLSDGPQIEENMSTVVAGYNSVFGDPYELIRIPMPPSTSGAFTPDASYRTYANNIFINKTVLVPTYRTEYDSTGLRILRESLPGYRVIGIDCDNTGMNIIQSSGAIHCITKGIGVADPLLIRHQALDDTYEVVAPYAVEAYMRHKSGIASANLYWTTDTAAGFATVPMSATADNNWSAAIPAQAAGATVFYYVEGIANSGKQQVRPIVAPEGWWSFDVLGIGTGLNGTNAPTIVDVYPNPTASIAMITLAAQAGHVHVFLADATGRAVMQLHNAPLHSDRRVFADLSGLASGVYLVVVESATGRTSQRVVRR